MSSKSIPLTIDATSIVIHAYFNHHGAPRHDPVHLQQYIARRVYLSKPLFDKRKDRKAILDTTVKQWARDFINGILGERSAA
jgi:hypothetical protein